jgi:hypothetical protein
LTHTPPAQQPAPQVLFAQQGWPGPPHAAGAPLSQMLPAVVVSPEGMQTFVTQQPPPPHRLPAQHACPGPPHETHEPAAPAEPATHAPPDEHAAFGARQVLAPGSQQPPPVHALAAAPGQHG